MTNIIVELSFRGKVNTLNKTDAQYKKIYRKFLMVNINPGCIFVSD